jgi:prephenate dehydrogenase
MQIAVVGLGLIGGSFYKAAKVAGYETAGLHHGDKTGFEQADIIIVCLPPANIVKWIESNCFKFKKGTIVVDICGVKKTIVDQVSKIPKDDWTFVGGHPMAGKEVSGFENSSADLFKGASMIITPTGDEMSGTVEKLHEFFSAVGFARIVLTTPERHDEMIAYTSQLCHVIATAFSRDEKRSDVSGFSAGSFANMTRIANQDSVIWTDLFLANKSNLLATVDSFISRISEFRDVLAKDDGAKIKEIILSGGGS